MDKDSVIASFFEKIQELNPRQVKFVKASLKELTEEEESRLARYIAFYDTYDEGAAGSYEFLCREVLREELLFKRRQSAEYRLSSGEESFEQVYSNDEYMRKYMMGLGITSFLWQNHRAMRRFYRENIPVGKVGYYLEIGVGHGQDFLETMQRCSFEKYVGYDISKCSILMTERLIGAISPEMHNYEFILGDFYDALPDRKYDAVVCSEVLEHVEKPDELLMKIRSFAESDAFIYLTTAVNSPALDHLYLFRSPDEVKALLGSCGLEVVKELIAPSAGKSIDEAVREKLALSVAYVVRPV